MKSIELLFLLRRKKRMFLLGFLLFSLNAVFSQSGTKIPITGTIADTTGQGIPTVTVSEKGTKNSTATGQTGSFSLNVAGQGSVLVVTSIGYASQEVPVGTSTNLTIRLRQTSEALGEVVVVGYGTQRRLAVTGAVSSIKGNQLAETPVSNISNSIAGRVAGVSMRPNGGQPGSDAPDIHIRGIGTTGNNNPLIVVDGVIRNNINQIDPSTIETVSVLKDAAAVAPYGLGGANGVILITTKRGKTGEPTLTFNSYYGTQTPTYYPKLLSAQDYMRLKNEAYLNENPTGTNLPFAKDLVDNYISLNAKEPDKYPISNTKDLVKMYAPMQNYNLQLSGGTQKIKYFMGLGYLKQDGMFDPVNYTRYNYNINLEAQATKTTTVSLSLLGSIERINTIDPSVSPLQLFRNGFKYIPIQSLYYSNGLWGEFAGNSPVGILKAGYARGDSNTLLTTLAIEQKLPFIKGLSIKGAFSYDPHQRSSKNWHTPFYYYTQNTATTPFTYDQAISTSEGGSASYTWLSQDYTKNQTFTYQGFLNYHNRFGKHDITGLIVAEARNSTYQTFFARRNNFAINIDELSLGSSNRNDYDNSGTSATGSQIGYVYRVGYNYDNKYLFEASGRYDGHYFFAPGKRWGYFPAFSAGWVLSQEDFFSKSLPFFDNFKLRGSWGKSGNLAGTAFQYLAGYNLYGNAYAFGLGNLVQGSYNPIEANPNLTWEIATKTDVGFESSLWKGLLTVEADYFRERREGMLLPPAVSVPVEYGLALAQQNAGIMQSSGFEFSIGSSKKYQNGLTLGINANFSYATNKMLQIFETAATYDNPNRSRTGRPFGAQFGYHSLGLFSTADDKNGDGIINADDGYNITQFGVLHPGDIKYADLGGGPDGKPDGKINSSDETLTGNPVYPLITYGISPYASWKGFDLNLFFQGSAQSSLDIRQFQTIPFNNNNSNSSYEYYNNHWTPATPNGKYPRVTQAPYENNTQSSDFWIANTGFVRLKNVNFGYTLPRSTIQSLKIKAVRLYVSGQNLLTISKLKFMDPEVSYTDREIGYPNQKVYTVGLDVTF